MKILEVKGDHRIIEISDIRVIEGGKGITFTICPLRAPIEGCHVKIIDKILPEPIEKKLLGGIITLRREREFLGETDIETPTAEGLKPLKRYKVCSYTKEKDSKETREKRM